MIQLNKLPEGEKCFDRPGSYAIITIAEKVVLVRIKRWGKYFLPGGGIDEGEGSEEALKREVTEETGYTVKVLEKVGEAAEYVYFPAKKSYINKLSQFFTAWIIDLNLELKIEEDHETVYLSKEEAVEILHLESHKWAVEQWIKKENNV